MRLRVLFAALFLALCANAQDETSQPGARLEQLQQRLNLSEDQRARIRPILSEEATKLRDIRAKYEGQDARRSRLSRLREMRGVEQDLEKRVTPLLTKQQQAERKKIRQERRDEPLVQRR